MSSSRIWFGEADDHQSPNWRECCEPFSYHVRLNQTIEIGQYNIYSISMRNRWSKGGRLGRLVKQRSRAHLTNNAPARLALHQ
jgi:hypothetical protein